MYPSDPRRAPAGGEGREHGCGLRRVQPDHLRKQRSGNLSGKDDDRGRHRLHADLAQPFLFGFPQGKLADGRRRQTGRAENGSGAEPGGAACPGCRPGASGPGRSANGEIGCMRAKARRSFDIDKEI